MLIHKSSFAWLAGGRNIFYGFLALGEAVRFAKSRIGTLFDPRTDQSGLSHARVSEPVGYSSEEADDQYSPKRFPR